MSEDNDYLKAISSIEETEGVIYPRDVVEDLSILGFDSKLVTDGCEEHIYCHTCTNFDWHYDTYYWSKKENENNIEPLDIYKKFISRPYKRGSEEYISDENFEFEYEWQWVFMIENQGCAEWFTCYDTPDDDPQIYIRAETWEGYEIEHCGNWEEFKRSRLDKK